MEEKIKEIIDQSSTSSQAAIAICELISAHDTFTVDASALGPEDQFHLGRILSSGGVKIVFAAEK